MVGELGGLVAITILFIALSELCSVLYSLLRFFPAFDTHYGISSVNRREFCHRFFNYF